MSTVLLVLRAALAIVFVTAGIAKLADLSASRQTMAGFGVPDRVARAGGTLLPFAELGTALALVIQPTARWGALAAVLLLLVFIAGITNALVHGRSPSCNCFGQVSSSRVSWRTLARNTGLALAAAVVVWKGPGSSFSAWTSNDTAAQLTASIAVMCVALLTVVALRYRRLSEAYRKLLFNTSTELANVPPGLPVGMLAPSIALPDITGQVVTLESLCDAGRPVALMFMSPSCGPCKGLLHDLVRWQSALGERMTFAVVSNGTPESQQLEVWQAAEDITVLVQEGQEIADLYRVRSTPMAIIVTPDRRIASAQAAGAREIEELVRLWVHRTDSAPRDLQPILDQTPPRPRFQLPIVRT